MNSIKKITLCADDFAFNTDVSDGILHLLEKKRLSATSCMVHSELWPEYAQALKSIRKNTDIGLHLNFTEQFPNFEAESLKKTMYSCKLRTIDEKKVKDQIKKQIDLFEDYFNSSPTFIDGHQHVHLFPVIRENLIQEIKFRYKQDKPYLRSLGHIKQKSPYLKILAIKAMGAYQFDKISEKENITINTSFAGFYNFNQVLHYEKLMPEWFEKISTNGLIMCHPAKLDNKNHPKDSIYRARVMEFNYFNSDLFLEDLNKYNVQLTPLMNNN